MKSVLLHHRVLPFQVPLARFRRRGARYWFAARVALWLCALPVRLRWFPLPVLLHRLSQQPSSVRRSRPLALPDLVHITMRLCRLPMFQGRLFPRSCLRQSLALYAMLNKVGYPVMIHFGVQKEGEIVQAHSWVTLHGQPLTERAPETHFALLYSYPLDSLTSSPIPDNNESIIQIGR